MQQISPLPNDFGSRLVKMRYQSLYVDLIKKYSVQINAMLRCQKSSQGASALNKEGLWDKLKQSNPLSVEIDEIEKLWLDIKEFGHLSTRELLTAYKELVRPLEQAYLRSKYEVDADLKHYSKYGLWRPNWYLKKQEAMLESLRHQVESIEGIKNDIFKALSARCLAYKVLKIDRHNDSLVKEALKRLNKLKGFSAPIPKAKYHRISDDERLEIFDLLSSHFPSQKDKMFPVVQDVRKAIFNPPVDSSQNAKFDKLVIDKASVIEAKNMLVSLAKLKYSSEKEEAEAKREKSLLENVKNYISSTMLSKFVSFIYKRRHLALTVLTLGLFVTYSSAITYPIALYSQDLANLANAMLLVGFGLSPAIIGGWGYIKEICSDIVGYFCYNKKQELHQAIEMIRDNQICLKELLSSGIHDTAHFDINRIERWQQHFKSCQADMSQKLDKFSIIERAFASNALKDGIKEANCLLKTQNKELNIRLKQYASHAVDRVGVDLTKLVIRANKGFDILISPNQIKKIGLFVKKHGTEEDNLKFKDSLCLKAQFKQSILDKKHLIETKHEMLAPWGGFKPFKSSLNGWSCLISVSGADTNLQIIVKVLMGDTKISPHEFKQSVASFQQDKDDLLPAIQSSLFASLNYLPAYYVHFLSIEHKRLINDWYNNNEKTIDKAYSALDSFIKHQNIDRSTHINKYVDLLDGALIASQLTKAPHKSFDLARRAVKNYNGREPRMYYLLRFFKESEKGEVALHMASKRLSFLLSNPKSTISDTDKEIFINIRLLVDVNFDFSSYVKKHSSFSKPWSKDYEDLLRRFRLVGLDDGELLNIYRKTNKNIKKYHLAAKDIQSSANRRVVANA